MVEKTDDGKLETVLKILNGPTSFITTTVMDKLESQLEDRLFTIHPDESNEQTRDIITLNGNMAADLIPELDEKTVASWKAFHESLKPIEVTIPFGPKIAEYINRHSSPPIATRRAFKRVLSVIKAVVCVYQFQRQKNPQGKVIAEICDYWMTLQIVKESFGESMGRQSAKNEERISFILSKEVLQYKDLKKQWGVSTQAVSYWVKEQVTEGILQWCDETGNIFNDDKVLQVAKRSGKGFIKVSDSYTPPGSIGLPTPYDLTGELDWDEGGKLLEKYDLQLALRPRSPSVSTGVNAVSMPMVYTLYTSNVIDNIEYNSDLGIGVNVSSVYRDSEGYLFF